MIYNLVSSKAVVAKVIADLDLKESELRITDIKEYIGEAMERIGSVMQLDHRVAVVPLNQYQAKFPCDLYRLDSVAYSSSDKGGWLPMTKTTNTFSVYRKTGCACGCEDDCCKNNCNDCNMYVTDDAMFPIVKNIFNITDDREALDKLNGNPNIRHTLSTLINNYTFGCGKCNNNCRLQYDVKPGYVFTNIEDGYLKMSYHSIHTDNSGMPMIPDNPAYFEAIYWYVVMKLSYPKYYNGTLPQHVYYDMRRSWNFYRQQAYAESLMPNTDELETISNTWHKIYPEINDHDRFFEHTGDEQHIYNQN